MVLEILSVARFCDVLFRRTFTVAGLSQQTLAVDAETTISFWGPQTQSDRDDKKPALLLLHGFGPSATWQWRCQVRELSPLFRLYVPDMVFFGASTSSSTSDRSEIFQATSMAKLMEKLGENKYDVVGTSYGGFVAYNLARMWPERTEKVVLASSGVNMRRSNNEEVVAKAGGGGRTISDVMMPSTAADLRTISRLASSWSLDWVPDFMLNDFVKNLYSGNRVEKLELLKGLSIGKDENVNLTPLRQDVLLIWGDEDQIFPVKLAHELKEILGQKARLELIKNTSHLPQLEKTQEFNKMLKDFLLLDNSK